MVSRRLFAWIGALSLAALGLAAIGGMVALRFLESGHLARVLTAAPPTDRSGPAAAAAGQADDPSGQAKPLSQTQSGVTVAVAAGPDDKARRDCMELLAGGEGAMLFQPATAGALALPGLQFHWEGGPLGEGGHGPLAALDLQGSLAKLLGITLEELHEALAKGETIADLAKAKGRALADLGAALQDQARKTLRDSLQARVDAGAMTAEEADRQAQSLEIELGEEGAAGSGLRFSLKLGGPQGLGRMMELHRSHGDDQGQGEAHEEADLVFGMVAGAQAQPFTLRLPEPLSADDRAAVEAVLEAAVTAGRLSRAQADAASARLDLPALPAIPAMPVLPAQPAAPAAPAGAAGGAGR